jgi:serine/threonine protein kinase
MALVTKIFSNRAMKFALFSHPHGKPIVGLVAPTKTCGPIVSLISGLQYLHSQGIVHRELKPMDLIVCGDQSVQMRGSLQTLHRHPGASQVGAPGDINTEIDENRTIGTRTRDAKTDAFSFALILFEILFGAKVFPSTLSVAIIMRKEMSWRPADSPVIATTVHPVLQTLIGKR